MTCPPRSSPTWTISIPFSTTGDIAVPQKSFEVSICAEKSLRHFSSPVFASKAERMAPTPSV